MSSWHSYPSIFNLGHRAVRDLLNYPHVVEEKVDGSQFSFGLVEEHVPFEDAVTGTVSQQPTGDLVLRVRSKGAEMNVDAPEKMFAKAVETAKRICSTAAEAAGVGAHPGWTYRCEYLAKPKHNTLAYDRVPTGHLIGFDVSTDDSCWLTPVEKEAEFRRIGLECVPTLWTFEPSSPGPTTLEMLRRLLDSRQSVLGGQLIEGVVIKPLVELYGVDKKTLMGKFVSERFKEAHKEAWKETSPTSGDILEKLIRTYSTQARWMKAVQHLRERGILQESPRDIGPLIHEVGQDLGKEEMEEIKNFLWKWAWPHIQRGSTRGLPEWYKQELLKLQFEQDHLGVTSDSGTPVAVEPIDDEPSSCSR